MSPNMPRFYQTGPYVDKSRSRRDADEMLDDDLFREGEHSGLSDIERAEQQQEERE